VGEAAESSGDANGTAMYPKARALERMNTIFRLPQGTDRVA
jgi:hypothetical protein